MIDFFRTWLPQIIGYAEMVEDGTLQKAWAEGDRSRTSVHYSDELVEQVFGDLNADEMMWEARQQLKPHPTLAQALELFLHSLRRLDAWIEDHVDTAVWREGEPIPPSVGSIFQSQEWWVAEKDAASVIAAARDAGFSSEDLDLTS